MNLYVRNLTVSAFMLLATMSSCSAGDNGETKAETTDSKVTNEHPETTAENGEVLRVYYFHTSYRCPSCLKIERYTKEAVEDSFEVALENGSMDFKQINIEEKGNEHYADDYKLYTKSVVLSEKIDDTEKEWKNLDQVWELLRNEDKFKSYIVSEIQKIRKSEG